MLYLIGLIWLIPFENLIFAQSAGYSEDEIIDITGLHYGRLRFSIAVTEIPEQNRHLFLHAVQLIRRNLKWSGLFDILEGGRTDLKLVLRFTPPAVLHGRIMSQDETLLFEISEQLNETGDIEKRLVELVESIILQLTGERSIFRSAIVYIRKDERSRYQLVMTDAFGKKKKVLLDDGGINILPRWHPDATSILFTNLGRKGSRIKQLNLQTGNVKTLFEGFGKLSGGSWGHNGRELIITWSKRGNSDLYRINLNTKEQNRLTFRSSSESNPRWSPDGERLLFVSNRSGTVQIYQTILKTGETFRMTFEGSYNVEPCWSNDGSSIVYAGVRNQQYYLFQMDREGEYNQQLTRDGDPAEQPVWAPNGRQILYVSKVGYDQKLYMIRSDGTFKRRLTDSGSGISEFNPTWTGYYRWSD